MFVPSQHWIVFNSPEMESYGKSEIIKYSSRARNSVVELLPVKNNCNKIGHIDSVLIGHQQQQQKRSSNYQVNEPYDMVTPLSMESHSVRGDWIMFPLRCLRQQKQQQQHCWTRLTTAQDKSLVLPHSCSISSVIENHHLQLAAIIVSSPRLLLQLLLHSTLTLQGINWKNLRIRWKNTYTPGK